MGPHTSPPPPNPAGVPGFDRRISVLDHIKQQRRQEQLGTIVEANRETMLTANLRASAQEARELDQVILTGSLVNTIPTGGKDDLDQGDLGLMANEIRFDQRLKDKAMRSKAFLGSWEEQERYKWLLSLISVTTGLLACLYIFLLPLISTPKWCLTRAK